MVIILIITLIALIVFIIWNLISYKAIKKNSKDPNQKLNDEKYYELKYKMEFLIATFSVIVALAGLLGYNSLKTINDEIRSELDKELSTIERQMQVIEYKLIKKDSLLNELELKTKMVSSNLSSSNNEISEQMSDVKSLEEKINSINSKSITSVHLK